MLKNVILLVLVLVCSFGSTAKAQLFLEEGKVVLAVVPGERINKSITISNTTDQEISVRAYWQDFEYQSPYDGSKAFVPQGSTKLSASHMITFSPLDFKLPGFGKQKIDYTISVPQTAKGGYYGVLFLEKAADPLQAQMGLSLVTRVGSLFFIETKDKSKHSEVGNVQIVSDKITGTFKNLGNAILIPRMTYNVFDKEGLVADRGELKKLYVPPGASADWDVNLPTGLSAGEYVLVLNTDLDDGDVIVNEMSIAVDAAGHLKIENIKD